MSPKPDQKVCFPHFFPDLWRLLACWGPILRVFSTSKTGLFPFRYRKKCFVNDSFQVRSKDKETKVFLFLSRDISTLVLKPEMDIWGLIQATFSPLLYLGKWIRDLDKKGQFTFSKGPTNTAWLKTYQSPSQTSHFQRKTVKIESFNWTKEVKRIRGNGKKTGDRRRSNEERSKLILLDCGL